MGKVHFITPTDLPLDAFTNFGVNHKPNSANPIGYFGTGLKYVVAIVARHGGTVTLTTPKGEYVFYGSDMDFRGKTFTGLRMKRRTGFASKWRYDQMPFTTELGKNWHMWQAFRELLSNTLDENGVVTDNDYFEHGWPTFSRITVECKDFERWTWSNFEAEVYWNRAERGAPDRVCGNLEIWDRPSKYIYYKGIRVFDLPENAPARRTYNFTAGIELSEDRTVRNQYLMQQAIIDAIDEMDPRTVAEILRKDDEQVSYEADVLPLRMVPIDVLQPKRGNIHRGLLLGRSEGLKFGYYSSAALASLERSPEEGSYSCDVQMKVKEWRAALTAINSLNSNEPPNLTEAQQEALVTLYDKIVGDINAYCGEAGIILKGLHDDHPEESDEG